MVGGGVAPVEGVGRLAGGVSPVGLVTGSDTVSAVVGPAVVGSVASCIVPAVVGSVASCVVPSPAEEVGADSSPGVRVVGTSTVCGLSFMGKERRGGGGKGGGKGGGEGERGGDMRAWKQ